MVRIKRIFLDLDGVLADFHGYLGEIYDIHPSQFRWETPLCETCGVREYELTSRLDTSAFWKQIPVCQGATELVQKCIDFVGLDQVGILSNPSEYNCHSGKMAWVDKYFSELRDRTFLGRDKAFLASPDTLLIDDHDDNVKVFRHAGGAGILVPRYWNSMAKQVESSCEVVLDALDLVFGD